MKIKDLLKLVEKRVISIGPDESAYSALAKLVANNIGALPVLDKDGFLLGIVSERDLLKEVLNRRDALDRTTVGEIMTGDVAVATPEDDLDYAITVMRQKKIRHLPIVAEHVTSIALTDTDKANAI